MKNGLSEDVINRINTIFSNYPQIEKVILYGSRAKGNYRNSSDIDLTIFSKSITIEDLYKIEIELDDLLLPYTIDLSIFSKISNPDLIDHIQRVGKDFYFKK
ncbi:MAG: nucleotidyltransferase domain-containing protein [Flavobacteriia bacterium]|nr:nucleotidyltransferase domain-containing protein [Flavobacteriia bacterium]